MSYNTKNYTEQGGNKTVIGGELEIMPDAKVSGFPIAENLAESTASTVAALKEDFNALLAILKATGLMKADETA